MSDIVERLRVFPVQGQRPPVHAALRNEAAASIESMRELLARANAEWQGCAAELEQANRRIVAMGEMNDALAARLAEAERDAARYRYMRGNASFRDRNGPGLYWYLPRFLPGGSAEQLDASIDASITADSASVVQYKPCEICTTQSWCETHGCQCYPVSAVQPERCCLDYPRCDCNSPPEPDSAPTLQPCGHPWKAQHDSKCILCSSPGTAQEKANE